MTPSENESKIIVNRLALFPEKRIPNNCPIFVVEFLAKSLGIRFDSQSYQLRQLIDTIESTLYDDTNRIDIGNLNEESLRDIALFVNPENSVEWKNVSNLMLSFWDIYNFSPKLPLKASDSFGLKTETNLYCIDPVMTYLIAHRYGIKVKVNTKLEDIQGEIYNYNMQLTPLREGILAKLTKLSRRGLIEIKNHFISPSPNTESHQYPTDEDIAIEKAASDYRWDISESSNPIAEYKELDRTSDDRYSPIDSKWRSKFNINRRYYHLDFRYISKYDYLYDPEIKKGLIYRNGGSEDTDYLTFGIHPEYKGDYKHTTIMMDPVPKDYPTQIRSLIGSPDFLVTIDELSEFWNFNKSFISPHDPSREFSEYHLSMLIINSFSHNCNIVKTINNIKIHRDNIIEEAKYNKDILYKILELGLIIRGYTICYDDYPLEESRYDIEKYQHIIEEKTYILAREIIDSHKEMVNSIPVMTGRNILNETSETYNIVTYGKDKTILNMIEQIFDVDSIDACIRTNSNYFLVTAWFFMNQLDGSSIFDITKLRFIS